MRVIVTRPQREAQRWVQDLTARGLGVVALPLIEVAAVTDAAPLRQAWQRLGDWAAVMFVSANAVAPFFASKPPLDPVFSYKNKSMGDRARDPAGAAASRCTSGLHRHAVGRGRSI